MKKLSLVAFVLFMFTGFVAIANDDHSANVCSIKKADVCGHIGHMSGMKVDTESKFMAHLEIPKNVQVEDFAIILWMPDMGHGSSPLTVKHVGVNKYQITEAYFVMPGNWEVRLSFKLDGIEHQLAIPVQITE